MFCPKLNFHIYIKITKGAKGSKSMLLFWGVPNASKNCDGVNQSGSFKKKNFNPCGATPTN
jgi:hypothetical protein